jgi:hypothetical protein
MRVELGQLGEHLVDARHGPVVPIGQHALFLSDLEILPDREIRKDETLIRHVANPHSGDLVRWFAAKLPSVECDGSLARVSEPHDGLYRGCFPGAVAAQQAHDLTALHLQRDAEQDVAGPVMGGDLAQRERAHHCCSPR